MEPNLVVQLSRNIDQISSSRIEQLGRTSLVAGGAVPLDLRGGATVTQDTNCCAGQHTVDLVLPCHKHQAPLHGTFTDPWGIPPVVKRCLVCPLFLTSVCILDCHAIRLRVCEYLVLSMHPTSIARYKQEKHVQLDVVLTGLICIRVTSQVLFAPLFTRCCFTVLSNQNSQGSRGVTTVCLVYTPGPGLETRQSVRPLALAPTNTQPWGVGTCLFGSWLRRAIFPGTGKFSNVKENGTFSIWGLRRCLSAAVPPVPIIDRLMPNGQTLRKTPWWVFSTRTCT